VTDALKGVVTKDEEAIKKLVEKGSDAGDAKNALFLEKKYGLKLELKDTKWTLSNGADKGATIANLARALGTKDDRNALSPQLQGILAQYLNNELKDVRTPGGRIALAQSLTYVHGGDWANPKIHEQIVNLAVQGKVPSEASYKDGAITLPVPTAAQKVELKKDAASITAMPEALKVLWELNK
jgi:hypothetical protein